MTDNIPLKQCSDCHMWKPATSEHFYRGRQYRDGLYARCKICWGAYTKARKSGEANLVRFKPTYNAEGMKQCRTCQVFKPATTEYFYRKSNASDGLHPHCKTCDNARKLDWIHKHPEEAKAQSERFHTLHPESSRRRASRYRSRHHEKVLIKLQDWRKSNKEHVKDYNHVYRQLNRAQVKIDHDRRRTRKLGLPNNFTRADWQYCLDYFQHCCAVCKRPLNGLFHTAAADHWIPLTKGGGSTAANIVPLCNGVDGCNQSKHNHQPDEWLVKRFGKRKAKRILSEIDTYFVHVRSRSSSQ